MSMQSACSPARKSPGTELTDFDVVALKPVLRQNEIEDVVRKVLGRAPGDSLPDAQKKAIVDGISRQIQDFPRPPVFGKAQADGGINQKEDPLFLGIEALMRKVTAAPGRLLILDEPSLPPKEAYIVTQLYDALQTAYKERAGEMRR